MRKCLQVQTQFRNFLRMVKTMKPFMKIGSCLLAVALVLTTIIATGCTPISLNSEWAYKTNQKTLPIGVYIYSLDLAYSQAQSFAQKLDDYDSTNDKWLDEKITDDDGNKKVARTWIKDEAQKMCLSYLVIEEQLKSEGATVDEKTLASADETAQNYWDVGQYASYGYYMPMSKDLEPFGISESSFAYCTTQYSAKYQALFDKIYGKGGSQEVSDNDLKDYFTKNYTDYSYFSVNLTNASTDEAGKSTTTAMSKADAKKLTDEFDGYAKNINNGDKSYNDVVKAYQKAHNVSDDPTTSNVESLDNSSIGDELVKAIKKLDTNKASTVKVGSDDSAVYYVVYKKDNKNDVDSYIKDEAKRKGVLSSMKKDDYSDYIEKLSKELKYDANTSVLNKYDPSMFFVKVEPTTAATTAAQTTAS